MVSRKGTNFGRSEFFSFAEFVLSFVGNDLIQTRSDDPSKAGDAASLFI